VIAVEVVYATAGGQTAVPLRLEEGSTVRDAIAQSGLAARLDDVAGAAAGVFGKVCNLDAPLHDGDRVEIYRPLAEDPKSVRRRRAAEAGKRARR
jgi:putative ubiquitin-RnfH superfamily antitoxin RatB of RatAB toxin-antitoxin module